ncbi:MAG: hypothetical protein EBT86_04370 [Actinobacteria bacterium]|nr:hypothetical protein [Actinomycetota bacterium]NDG27333.1 hypothetical protein [Pseudomonadota bacterium]
MPSLTIFPNGTKVRHEAYIRNVKINTLYGVITNGMIETNELGLNQRFKNPMEFIRAHKIAKIKRNRYHSVNGNPWKIVQYWETDSNCWRNLSEFVPQTNTISTTALVQKDAIKKCDLMDDDTESFVSCISELNSSEEIDTESDSPFRITWEHLDTIHIWQWKFWAKTDFVESWSQMYYEFLQDDANLDEIEEELDYEAFSQSYPWITHHNLPYEEELWIALKTVIPQFGEVWMDGWGNCWEVIEENDCLANAGKWIGHWSWDSCILNLAAKEPATLLSSDEFWDVIQDFDEPILN